jgi:hypothetical protein
MNWPALISLLATLMALTLTILMAAETLAVAEGRDPLSNGVRRLAGRVPGLVFSLAVVIGMVLGHLLWP